jgi:glutamate/tyrosine decarboxylase-like PLP-dependent enzyme
MKYAQLLQETCDLAVEYLQRAPDRAVAQPVEFSTLLASMGGVLPEEPRAPLEVIEQLAKAADPGVVSTVGPRYFGFVTGGSLPVTVAADWLAAAWDQNAFCYVSSPAAAAAEEIAANWLLELFGLSREMSVGFTTGATMANFTALAAARHLLLKGLGWNVEEQGLAGAPEFTVVTSDESHVVVFASLQMLGLGRNRVTRITTDRQGRMRPDELRSALDRITTPVLVCAQAGNVNTGAFDPIDAIAACLSNRPAWLHVDGSFGLWAAVSPNLSQFTNGIALADSIAVDCHKWLNVPYDSGVVMVRDRESHQAAMTLNAPYYAPGPEVARENHNWVPEASRRARGFAVYAALRTLGRQGVVELIERCCALAQRMADRLRRGEGVEILNDVVLNQVLVRFLPPDPGRAAAFTAEVIRRVQEEGTCWAGGTSWHGMPAMRISVSNWSTTAADIDLSADSILRCLASARQGLENLIPTKT